MIRFAKKYACIVVAFALLFGIVSETANAASSSGVWMSLDVKHWGVKNGAYVALTESDVWSLISTGATWRSTQYGERTYVGNSKVTYHFPPLTAVNTTLSMTDKFGQTWGAHATHRAVMSGEISIAGVDTIKQYHGAFAYNANTGETITSGYTFRIGLAGYFMTDPQTTAFTSNTTQLRDSNCWPLIFTGGEGKYSMYMIYDNGAVDEWNIAGPDLYDPEYLVNLPYAFYPEIAALTEDEVAEMRLGMKSARSSAKSLVPGAVKNAATAKKIVKAEKTNLDASSVSSAATDDASDKAAVMSGKTINAETNDKQVKQSENKRKGGKAGTTRDQKRESRRGARTSSNR